MEASEKKVSTRVRGAAWRRKDAPKARGVSFPGRHGGVEEMREERQMRKTWKRYCREEEKSKRNGKKIENGERC